MEISHASRTQSAPANKATIVFPLKSLPAEIRKFIYPHNNALALPHDSKTIPALLLALAADKELFEEALEMYKSINVVVTKQNIEQFKGMRMKDLLKFRHLKIVCDVNESDQQHKDCFSFRAHKVLLHNNFESLTYVVDKEVENWPIVIDWAEFLLIASWAGVKKVTFRLALDFEKNNRKARLDRVREKLGIRGESTEDWYDEDHTGYRVLVWERADGGSLKPLSAEQTAKQEEVKKLKEALKTALVLYEEPRKFVI
jgi:hypothetical protein